METAVQIIPRLTEKFGASSIVIQRTMDDILTIWADPGRFRDVLSFLKTDPQGAYPMLFDLSAIDERSRAHREGQPKSDFTVIYHLLSFDRNEDIRVKVPLAGERPSLKSITDMWPNADWYEREVWDMFGIRFEAHPNLRRILMPPWWEGHPLRKEHPARATEMGGFSLDDETTKSMLDSMEFSPEAWGLPRRRGDRELLFVNIGPQHPGTHGILRVVAALDGEEIVDLVCDIGFHHRGAEKMAERQSWHTFIPYTDRVDYAGAAMNNFPYVLAVEKLAGITPPDRAKVIRIMLAELSRIISHLVFYGTFSQDTGQMSPVFYMFTDRERAFDILEAITGGRMHPAWFRIGGVAQDLPEGWEEMLLSFVKYMRHRLKDYNSAVMKNRIFKARTKGIGVISLREAVEWGATGPFLRACGFEWDFRKKRPYGGYEQFVFDVPTESGGDSYDRLAVHVEEMRQSLRIIEQCVHQMPPGPYKADHPLAVPPAKERVMHDIETLIDHFLGVSWGPVIPPGEACAAVEATKGNSSYYLVSDGNTAAYRARIRTPSFAHIQMVPMMSRGLTVPDLIAILGSVDYVLSDVDR
jgi:NADH-quinone oxidoreductase subunit C/D